MERIGIAGLSLHDADVAGLERLARPGPVDYEGFARQLADALAASELVLLSTCNRVEVIFARELGHLPSADDRDVAASALGLAADDPLRARMHLATGSDAVRHLLRVAASLDSMVLGEDQILAQVRDAYATCERAGLVGRLLGALFEHAFQVGKQVRTDTELSRVPVSVVSIALEQLARHFAGRTPRIALAGAGAMAELLVKNAHEHGVTLAHVANRTPIKARRLAERCGARATTLEELLATRGGFDAVISATASPGFVFDAATLLDFARRTPLGGPLVAVDLALPRDIEPVDSPCVLVIDMQSLRGASETNRARRAAAAAEAEAIVERKLELFARRAARSAISDAIADMTNESEHVFERELAHLFTGRLAHVQPADRVAIESWARTAFGRVSHVPISALKRLASERTLFGPAQGEEGAG
jgi:glutamyl-tRNA reductase